MRIAALEGGPQGHPRQRRQPRRDLRRLEALVGRAPPRARRGTRRRARRARGVLRLAEPARPRGDRRRCRRGGRVPRLRPLPRDDRRGDPGRRRRSGRVPALSAGRPRATLRRDGPRVEDREHRAAGRDRPGRGQARLRLAARRAGARRRHVDAIRGRHLREMLDELGPTFVKFGQLLSTRPDIVPPDIIAELRGLQDDVKPFPFADVERVIAEDLEAADRAALPRVRRDAAGRGLDRAGAPRACSRTAAGSP